MEAAEAREELGSRLYGASLSAPSLFLRSCKEVVSGFKFQVFQVSAVTLFQVVALSLVALASYKPQVARVEQLVNSTPNNVEREREREREVMSERLERLM